jgi:hypothetical protein
MFFSQFTFFQICLPSLLASFNITFFEVKSFKSSTEILLVACLLYSSTKADFISSQLLSCTLAAFFPTIGT